MKDTPEKRYYSISEVSDATKIKAHVLRYWESQFSMLRPRKSRGGIRMYRDKDLSLIDQIKHLLYDCGYTIAGARRKLLEERRVGQAGRQKVDREAREGRVVEGKRRVARGRIQGVFNLQGAGERGPQMLLEIRREIEGLRDMLDRPPGSEGDEGAG